MVHIRQDFDFNDCTAFEVVKAHWADSIFAEGLLQKEINKLFTKKWTSDLLEFSLLMLVKKIWKRNVTCNMMFNSI